MFQTPAAVDFVTETAEDEEDCLKLFVGGLNYLSFQEDIKSYFETFGHVTKCTLLVDKNTGKSRGFAFVNIFDPEEKLEKKIFSRKHEINGKIVDVKIAVEGQDRVDMLDATKKIFVGGLDPDVRDDDLKEFFEKYGPVKDSPVILDNNRSASRCFGFVTFEYKETVEEVLKKGNRFYMKGRLIDVKKADPKLGQKTQLSRN